MTNQESHLRIAGKSISVRRRIEIRDGYIFVLPALLIISIFVIYPAIQMFIMSANQYSYIGGVFTAKFIGLKNYIIAFNDPLFFKTMGTSLLFPLMITPIQTALALLVAVLLYRNTKFAKFLRTLYFTPMVISFVAAAMFWKSMLNTNDGVINALLSIIGLPRQMFLTSPHLALISIVVVCIWKGWGWYMVIFASALNEISPELYESANLDGANAWNQFWFITLPMLRRAMLFVIIMSTMNTIKIFTPVMVMTGGGPRNSTEVIVHYIWSAAFRNNSFGTASAMSVMLFFIILLITLIQYRLMNSEE